MLNSKYSLTPFSLCFFNQSRVVNLNWFLKIQQCTTDLRTGQTLGRKLPFVQSKAVGHALHRQPSEDVQHPVEAETTDVSKVAVEAETTNTPKITDFRCCCIWICQHWSWDYKYIKDNRFQMLLHLNLSTLKLRLQVHQRSQMKLRLPMHQRSQMKLRLQMHQR